MKKAVLFDFDGTLYKGTVDLNAWCFARALEEMGLPPADRDMLDQSVGLTFRDIARLMTRSDSDESLARFQALTFQFVPRYIETHVRPEPQVGALLDALKPQASLAICSNAAPEYLLPMTRALEIDRRFDLIWPHREGMDKAAAIPRIMAQLAAERAVFVGDRLEDVTAARAAGIPVVGVRNAAYPRETDGADIAVQTNQEMQRAIETLLGKE